MKKYESPTITITEEYSEQIYAAGSNINTGETAEDSTTGTTTKCKSKYMQGTFVVGTYAPITDGYKKGRGCEGCPANWGHCAVEQCNYDGDFRPSWEVAGHLPDELGY